MNEKFERNVIIHRKTALKFLERYFKITGIETNVLESRDLNMIIRKVLREDIRTGVYSKRKVMDDEGIIPSTSSFQAVCTEITFRWLHTTCGIDPYSVMRYERKLLCDLIAKIRFNSEIAVAI
ncbi:MAG: hypothetical protein ACI9GH_000214 [Candidatus Paceibacteria bacterium]|jgi:hypothetical protein